MRARLCRAAGSLRTVEGMYLAPDARSEILNLLNQEEAVAAFVQAVAEHPGRQDWQKAEGETPTMATDLFPFRSQMVGWLNDRIKKRSCDLRKEQGHDLPLHRYVRACDFFFWSGADWERPDRGWLAHAELPIVAYRVLDVFEFSASALQWTARPWLGSAPYTAGRYDPLLTLPYSRGAYDWRRHERADREGMRQWERFRRAAELLGVAEGIVSRCDTRVDGRFEPDLKPVAEAFAADDLAVETCPLVGHSGRLHLDLWELEAEQGNPKPLAQRRQIPGPPVVQATYDGPLTILRYGSAATRKQKLLHTLEKLAERLWDGVLYCPDDDWEEHEQDLIATYDRFGLPRPDFLEADDPPTADDAPRDGDGGNIGGCPECGAATGLHALSCSRYAHASEPVAFLTEAELEKLRALAPYQWQAWPPDEYDQGLPVVELRQEHLRALLHEVEEHRCRG